jgi:hypothetical protein
MEDKYILLMISKVYSIFQKLLKIIIKFIYYVLGLPKGWNGFHVHNN